MIEKKGLNEWIDFFKGKISKSTFRSGGDLNCVIMSQILRQNQTSFLLETMWIDYLW